MPPSLENIFAIVDTGQYPPTITATTLANYQNTHGFTALHYAAIQGKLPKHTTSHDLAACSDCYGTSPLHEAAHHNHLPNDTTATDLLQPPDRAGIRPIHLAVLNGHLPPRTTTPLLRATTTKTGTTAWEYLANYCQRTAHQFIQSTPPEQFHGDTEIAILFAQNAIRKEPTKRATIIIWLGHVFALHNRLDVPNTRTSNYNHPFHTHHLSLPPIQIR